MITGFHCYRIYTALKAHFHTDTYDYIKYNGQVRLTEESYQKNKARKYFEGISRKHTHQKRVESFFISNFVEHPHWRLSKYIEDPGASEDTYIRWLGRQGRLTYIFENDLQKIVDDCFKKKYSSIVCGFEISEGETYPAVLKLFLHSDISPETIAALNDVLNLFPKWRKLIHEQIVFPEVDLRIRKYIPFMEFDRLKFKNLCRKILL